MQGFVEGGVYFAEVDEDPDAIASNPRVPLQLTNRDRGTPLTAAQARTADLTKQLKALSPAELAAQSKDYKELLEARELEDILYG